MKFDLRQRWFLAFSRSSLLPALLVFAVFLGPYSFATDAHAQHHESHSSTGQHDHDGDSGHHDSADGSDHSGVGHALTHCGSGSCTPTFVGTPANPAAFSVLSYRALQWFGNDADLRSLYLDADPPVPRDGFSLT
ncbi:MAG: hypothetical protein ACI9MJ_001459 [Alphaproteobacteria bacterium]